MKLITASAAFLAVAMLGGCVGGPDESARPAVCEDAKRAADALRRCVLSAPDAKTREGCLVELDAMCGYDAR